MLLGILGPFAYCVRHLVRFAQAGAYVTRAIADDDYCAKTETTSAFDDLGHAVYVHYAFFEIEF
jgi:hypothetical protein